MKIAIYTQGCKVNQYDSESLREQLTAAGHTVVSPDETGEEPDAVLLNTCTVTAESDRKNRQLLHKCRRRFPDALLVLTGCMVQAFPERCAALTDADLVLSPARHAELPALLETLAQDRTRLLRPGDFAPGEPFSTPGITRFSGRTRAFMKIEDGCEHYCTYCVIPRARGPVRSRPLPSVAAEAQRLADAGFAEIVLTGINLTAYGRDLPDANLGAAVAAVCAPAGIRRVRLGSLEPDLLDDDLLEQLAAQEKFCPQFHLSLQAGCDATLRRMNRPYDVAAYRALVERIRARFPDCGLTTDVMVGFAGESRADFEESLAFVEEMGFARVHVFAYSRRAGTMAYGMPNQIPRAEKEARSRAMQTAAERSAARFRAALLGTRQEVLFETAADGVAEGYTRSYVRVRTPGDERLCGEIRTVRLLENDDAGCRGVLDPD